MELKDLIEEVNNSNFASIRGIVTGIFDIINSSKSSVNDLERIIKLDPPLATKVLKVANSAFFASRVEFKDLKEAVLWIGFEEIKNIAITQQLYKVFLPGKKSENFSRKDLWKNSIATALLAKMIFRREFGEKGAHIYTAGLIHNIGTIILDQFDNENLDQVLTLSKDKKINQIDAENKLLKYNHTEIAHELGKSWNFPDELLVTIRYHHLGSDHPDIYKKETETLWLVDYFCNKWELGFSDLYFLDKEKAQEIITTHGIEENSIDLMYSDLIEQISHFENIGLLSNE